MRSPSVWVIGLAAAVIALVAGGIFWAREWAVADPKLEVYALELLPDGAEIVLSRGEKCDASNGWDRLYRPQDTCHQVVWLPPDGLAPEDRARALVDRAEQTGWQAQHAEGSGWMLKRPGYDVVIRVAREEALARCKALPAEQRICGDSIVVRKD
jgi:hypothetical protein